MTNPTTAAMPTPGQRYPLTTEGAWVVFDDPEDITGNDYKRAVNAIRATAEEAGNLEESTRALGLSLDFLDGIAIMAIAEWHIPYTPKGLDPQQYAPGAIPIPATNPTLLGALKLRDYRTIIGLVTPLARQLGGREVTPDDAGVPGTPTPPAGG